VRRLIVSAILVWNLSFPHATARRGAVATVRPSAPFAHRDTNRSLMTGFPGERGAYALPFYPPWGSSRSKVPLVLRDGTVRFAIAVWLQDGMLCYTTQDGVTGRTQLDAIDREATRRLNAGNRLNLWLADTTAQ
jgi:hypothetical protein